MDIDIILRDLKDERDRLTRAIDALEGITIGPKAGRAAPRETQSSARRGRRTMSAAQRKRISEMMKKRWAERRKAK